MKHIKKFSKMLHKLILDSLPWTTTTWKEIFEDISIKLSVLLYPFLFIYYFFWVIIVCRFNLKEGLDWNWFLENTKE